MQTIIITGGTGLVGTALSKMLAEKGFKVIILSRSTNNKLNNENIKYALWDVSKKTIDLNAIASADFIIHLAGAAVVEKKWTVAYKKEIVESRTKSSEFIVETLKNNPNKVQAIISSSAIGWYGADKIKGHQFIETDPVDSQFLGETCRLWEESIEPASSLGIRVCKLRTGIVLSKYGGALAEFIKPIKLGIAAILGNGKQIVSWIHVEDLCRMFVHAIENKNLNGSYNAVAPAPVSNKTLTITLAKILRNRFYIPIHVPSFILKIMMGQRSIEVLKSADISCEKIRNTGFIFLYPSIEVALKQLTKK